MRIRLAIFCILYLIIFTTTYTKTSKQQNYQNLFPKECVCYITDKYYDFNRKMFTLHSKLNKILLKPIIVIYRLIPTPLRNALVNFCTNLEFILFKGMNTILQGDLKGFTIETRNFVINSTLGAGGILKIAKKLKKKSMDNHNSNQYMLAHTLAKYGFKHKFYLFIPIFGPMSILTLIDLLITEKINKRLAKLNSLYNTVNSLEKYKIVEKTKETAKKLLLHEYSLLKSGFTNSIQIDCPNCS